MLTTSGWDALCDRLSLSDLAYSKAVTPRVAQLASRLKEQVAVRLDVDFHWNGLRFG